MAEKLDPKEPVTIEKLLITHMFEIAALIEILDRKGFLTKQEMRDEFTALRRKTLTAEHGGRLRLGQAGGWVVRMGGQGLQGCVNFLARQRVDLLLIG